MSRLHTDTRNDLQDNFAPVVNDMTLKTVLTLTALYDWDLAILDVETALLYRDLKEDIYMDLPAGFFSLDENILRVTDILENKFEMKQANKNVLKIKSCTLRFSSSREGMVAKICKRSGKCLL